MWLFKAVTNKGTEEKLNLRSQHLKWNQLMINFGNVQSKSVLNRVSVKIINHPFNIVLEYYSGKNCFQSQDLQLIHHLSRWVNGHLKNGADLNKYLILGCHWDLRRVFWFGGHSRKNEKCFSWNYPGKHQKLNLQKPICLARTTTELQNCLRIEVQFRSSSRNHTLLPSTCTVLNTASTWLRSSQGNFYR